MDDSQQMPDGGTPTGHATWDSLNDLLDGRLGSAEARTLELHLTDCAECREELEALRAIHLEATALPSVAAPPENLWQDVSASIANIKAPVSAVPSSQTPELASASAPAQTPPRPPRSPRTPRPSAFPTTEAPKQPIPRAWLAAAAIVLMALSSGLTALYMNGANRSTQSVATASPDQPAPTILPAAFIETERTYLASVAEVQALLDSQRAILAPATIQTVDRALATIDAAITEARAALLADPANRALAELLETSYRQKLDLLRRTAGLHQTS